MSWLTLTFAAVGHGQKRRSLVATTKANSGEYPLISVYSTEICLLSLIIPSVLTAHIFYLEVKLFLVLCICVP